MVLPILFILPALVAFGVLRLTDIINRPGFNAANRLPPAATCTSSLDLFHPPDPSSWSSTLFDLLFPTVTRHTSSPATDAANWYAATSDDTVSAIEPSSSDEWYANYDGSHVIDPSWVYGNVVDMGTKEEVLGRSEGTGESSCSSSSSSSSTATATATTSDNRQVLFLQALHTGQGRPLVVNGNVYSEIADKDVANELVLELENGPWSERAYEELGIGEAEYLLWKDDVCWANGTTATGSEGQGPDGKDRPTTFNGREYFAFPPDFHQSHSPRDNPPHPINTHPVTSSPATLGLHPPPESYTSGFPAWRIRRIVRVRIVVDGPLLPMDDVAGVKTSWMLGDLHNVAASPTPLDLFAAGHSGRPNVHQLLAGSDLARPPTCPLGGFHNRTSVVVSDVDNNDRDIEKSFGVDQIHRATPQSSTGTEKTFAFLDIKQATNLFWAEKSLADPNVNRARQSTAEKPLVRDLHRAQDGAEKSFGHLDINRAPTITTCFGSSAPIACIAAAPEAPRILRDVQPTSGKAGSPRTGRSGGIRVEIGTPREYLVTSYDLEAWTSTYLGRGTMLEYRSTIALVLDLSSAADLASFGVHSGESTGVSILDNGPADLSTRVTADPAGVASPEERFVALAEDWTTGQLVGTEAHVAFADPYLRGCSSSWSAVCILLGSLVLCRAPGALWRKIRCSRRRSFKGTRVTKPSVLDRFLAEVRGRPAETSVALWTNSGLDARWAIALGLYQCYWPWCAYSACDHSKDRGKRANPLRIAYRRVLRLGWWNGTGHLGRELVVWEKREVVVWMGYLAGFASTAGWRTIPLRLYWLECARMAPRAIRIPRPLGPPGHALDQGLILAALRWIGAIFAGPLEVAAIDEDIVSSVGSAVVAAARSTPQDLADSPPSPWTSTVEHWDSTAVVPKADLPVTVSHDAVASMGTPASLAASTSAPGWLHGQSAWTSARFNLAGHHPSGHSASSSVFDGFPDVAPVVYASIAWDIPATPAIADDGPHTLTETDNDVDGQDVYVPLMALPARPSPPVGMDRWFHLYHQHLRFTPPAPLWDPRVEVGVHFPWSRLEVASTFERMQSHRGLYFLVAELKPREFPRTHEKQGQWFVEVLARAKVVAAEMERLEPEYFATAQAAGRKAEQVSAWWRISRYCAYRWLQMVEDGFDAWLGRRLERMPQV